MSLSATIHSWRRARLGAAMCDSYARTESHKSDCCIKGATYFMWDCFTVSGTSRVTGFHCPRLFS